jgi:hypothetical protein
MPKKTKKMILDWFGNLVVEAFKDEKTTFEQRQRIVTEWEAGNLSYVDDLGEITGLPPAALLVAAFVDMEHSLLVSATGNFKYMLAENKPDFLTCSIVILQYGLHKKIGIYQLNSTVAELSTTQ